MSHTDGFEVLEGYSQSFRATVSDDDSEYASLEVAWFVGEDNVCDWTYGLPLEKPIAMSSLIWTIQMLLHRLETTVVVQRWRS